MMSAFSTYTSTKPYLICIDSDGCVMDTMNVKHFECFGPMVIEEWNLNSHQDEILELWNHLNLFSKTRGINRFQGLSLLFSTLAMRGIEISGREALAKWCEVTTSLSNAALQQEIDRTNQACLIKAMSWSQKVNEAIQALPKVDCVFPNAKEAMAYLHEYADIAIVSSANKEAVVEEWTRLNCMQYVSMLCGQDAGTKAFCISQLKQHYDSYHVLMVGDALSDLHAAQENHVPFYPILAAHEASSWARLKEDVGPRFLAGQLDNVEIKKLAVEMEQNLS